MKLICNNRLMIPLTDDVQVMRICICHEITYTLPSQLASNAKFSNGT